MSNPPNVKTRKKLMNKNVLQWEPHLALFVDDDDPFVFYKTIKIQIKKKLKLRWFIIF